MTRLKSLGRGEVSVEERWEPRSRAKDATRTHPIKKGPAFNLAEYEGFESQEADEGEDREHKLGTRNANERSRARRSIEAEGILNHMGKNDQPC